MEDRHVNLINWVSSLFDDSYSGKLREYNYLDYRPEPVVLLNDGTPKTPDIVAVNYDQKIVLIIECKGGLDKEAKKYVGIETEPIIKQTEDYSNINLNSMKKYFPNIDNLGSDVILTTYEDIQNDFENMKDHVNSKGRAFWLFQNSNPRIFKKYGEHIDDNLNNLLSPSNGIDLPSKCPTIIYYSRTSDTKTIVGEGLIRLFNYAVSYSDFEYNIEKIDDILQGDKYYSTKNKRMLWQLNKDERYKKWRKILNQGKEKRFLKEKSYGNYSFIDSEGKFINDKISNYMYNKIINNIKKEFGTYEEDFY